MLKACSGQQEKALSTPDWGEVSCQCLGAMSILQRVADHLDASA